MSKRERILGIAIGALILLAGLDYFALSPLLQYIDDVETQTARAEEDLRQAMVLVNNADTIDERWKTLLDAGLRDDESTVRARVQQHISDWASDSRFDLTTFVSGRTTKETGHDEIEFVITGNGPLKAVSRFVSELSTSDIPLRIQSLDLSSRSEKDDKLAARMIVSTIILPQTAKESQR